MNPAVGCHYFPPGLLLPSQPLRVLLPSHPVEIEPSSNNQNEVNITVDFGSVKNKKKTCRDCLLLQALWAVKVRVLYESRHETSK